MDNYDFDDFEEYLLSLINDRNIKDAENLQKVLDNHREFRERFFLTVKRENGESLERHRKWIKK